jgi:hypothetical protein
MPVLRTPARASVALLAGLALFLTAIGLLFFAALPLVGLQPAHPGRFERAQPLVLAVGAVALLAGAGLLRAGWRAARCTGAACPRYAGWRYTSRFGLAFALTWLYVSFIIRHNPLARGLLMSAVFLAAFTGAGAAIQRLWPRPATTEKEAPGPSCPRASEPAAR